jgi:tRNA (uracil-5-)-methyltransferase
MQTDSVTTETSTDLKGKKVGSSSSIRLNGEALVACYPEKYDQLFYEKRLKLASLLNYPIEKIVYYESPKTHYRMRTNFQLWHDHPKDRIPEGVYYAMYGDCPVDGGDEENDGGGGIIKESGEQNDEDDEEENGNETQENEKDDEGKETGKSGWKKRKREKSQGTPTAVTTSGRGRGKGKRKIPYEIISFPRGTERLNYLMEYLMKNGIKVIPDIFENLFEVRFMTTKLDSECIIVLCYKKPLSEKWLEIAEKLASDIGYGCKIIGRSRGVVRITSVNGNSDRSEYIKECLTIKGKNYDYYQTEGAFSQPNAIICEKMIEWSIEMSISNYGNHSHNPVTDDLLELYCGGGTFTAPFAHYYRKVLATEISKSSVSLAKKCFAMNNITNIDILRASSEEFTEAYKQSRLSEKKEENKEENQEVGSGGDKGVVSSKSKKPLMMDGKILNLSSYHITTVFVDPPRAGLDQQTCLLISQFPRIIYVSCNPITLARDVEMLLKTHDIYNVAAFDQFPYTDHLESGVLLIKKATASTTGSESINTTVDDESQQAKKQKLES